MLVGSGLMTVGWDSMVVIELMVTDSANLGLYMNQLGWPYLTNPYNLTCNIRIRMGHGL